MERSTFFLVYKQKKKTYTTAIITMNGIITFLQFSFKPSLSKGDRPRPKWTSISQRYSKGSLGLVRFYSDLCFIFHIFFLCDKSNVKG